MQTKFSPTRIRIGQSRYFWNRPKSSSQPIMSTQLTVRKHHFPVNISLCSRRCERFLWQKNTQNMAFYSKFSIFYEKKIFSGQKVSTQGNNIFSFLKKVVIPNIVPVAPSYSEMVLLLNKSNWRQKYDHFSVIGFYLKNCAAGEIFGKEGVSPMRFSWKTTMFL